MSDTVPKRSRLRRRAANDESSATAAPQQQHAHLDEPVVPSIQPSPRPNLNANDNVTTEEAVIEAPIVQPERISPRSVPIVAPDIVDPSPRLQEERRGSRQSNDSRQQLPPTLEPEESPNEDPAALEEEPLVPARQEPSAPADPKPKKRGFHFRRHPKGHDEVPTEEPAGNAAPAPSGFGVQDNRGVRPMPRYLQHSIFDCLVQSNLLFGLGYNVSKFNRYGRFEDANPGLRLDADADGLSLGITVSRMHSYGEHIVGIVKPLVKIHAVSLSTGQYIRSRNLPAVAPVTTRPCSLFDATASPTWRQELVLNAYFSDLVAEDALLLFEVLDDKPSFRADYSRGSDPSSGSGMPIAKRVAWGYLLPIGYSGELNVGFSEDWKYSVRRGLTRKGEGAGRRDAHSANDALENIAEEENEDGQSIANRTGEGERESERNREREAARGRSGSPMMMPLQAHSHDSNEEQEQEKEKERGLAKGKKSAYPWDKPSVDKNVRVQLYAYRQHDGLFGMIQRKIKGWPTLARYKDNGESSYPDGVPEVYVQWRLQRRLPVQGAYLCLKLGPRPAEMMPILLNAPGGLENMNSPMGDRSLGHEEGAAHTFNGLYAGRRGRLWAGSQGGPQSTAALAKLRSALLKRTRGAREPCVVPDKVVQRVDVGTEGALVVSFSHSGHILAIVAKTNLPGIPLSSEGVLYSIILYDTDLKEEVWVEDAAHHGPIYDLKWSRDDRCLLSCSGDGTCKVWDMTPTAFRSSNTMGFGALNASTDAVAGAGGGGGRLGGNSLDVASAQAGTGTAAGSKPPTLICTMVASPPVYTYTAVFQDQPGPITVGGLVDPAGRLPRVPRVITGGADGKLRVWDGPEMVGFVVVVNKDKEKGGETGAEVVDYSPHEGQINSIVIDERSRYMISGDSFGDIFAWRCDVKGWYQLLRKFKRDAVTPTTGLAAMADHNTGGGVLSFSMHPDKHKGQLLALLRQPSVLKVINLSTYKTHCVCAGFSGYSAVAAGAAGGIFNRATYSADGRYAVAGSSGKAQDGLYRVQVWDTSTGHVVRTPLSDMMFPYPVRSLSWHPKQHLLAVSMVGHGAAVILYAGDRESADKATERMNAAPTSADQDQAAAARADEEAGAAAGHAGRASHDSSSSSAVRMSQERTSAGRAPLSGSSLSRTMTGARGGTRELNPPKVTDSLSAGGKSEEMSKLLQSERAKDMLERIRAAKAAKQQNM